MADTEVRTNGNGTAESDDENISRPVDIEQDIREMDRRKVRIKDFFMRKIKFLFYFLKALQIISTFIK